MRNVALDMGQRIAFCEVRAGEVVGRKMVSDFAQLEGVLGRETPPAVVAVEACREAWAAERWLRERGHTMQLVDTTRVRALGIGHHNRKTDRIDAETLARAVERGMIPQAHLLSESSQAMRLQMSARRGLVESRTNFIVMIRHLLRARGVRVPSCNADDFVKPFGELMLSDEDKALTTPLLEMLKALAPQYEAAEQRLKELVAGQLVLAKLRTAPGVGPIVSAAFVCVVDSPHRFKTAHELESYLGLVPSEFTSGKQKLGSITKRGNAYLRTLLVQASWNILRSRRAESEPLVAWAHQVAARRGRKVAVLAIARKLAGILWAMWRDDAIYQPKRAGQSSAEGLARGRPHPRNR